MFVIKDVVMTLSGKTPSLFRHDLVNCTLHAARCTLHAARCTLHAARCTLHALGGPARQLQAEPPVHLVSERHHENP